MSFICQQCGFRGKKAKLGACPACGSSNLRTELSGTLAKEKVDKYRHIKIAIMIIAWSAFTFELVRLLSK